MAEAEDLPAWWHRVDPQSASLLTCAQAQCENARLIRVGRRKVAQVLYVKSVIVRLLSNWGPRG